MIASLPPLLMTSDPGSFAQRTIVRRKPLILSQVIEDNDYPPEVVDNLGALRDEIANGGLQSLVGAGDDVLQWNRDVLAFRGRNWLELPWYFAEAYFYRRLLEAVQYYEPGPWQTHDPFLARKRPQENGFVDWWTGTRGLISGTEGHSIFEALLHQSLWGNRADLSNFTVEGDLEQGAVLRTEVQHLVINDTQAAQAVLGAGTAQVSIIADNTGRELISDLLLARHLLTQGWTARVVFHLKDHPFFVSDAMIADMHRTVDLMQSLPEGQDLTAHLSSNRIALRDHPFWTSGLMFQQMPPDLAAQLSQSDLVILKGDVNYRRLLGDRHWPYDTTTESITTYFPAPVLVLRTLKGEIITGLTPGQAARLGDIDPSWLINGKRGIIQLLNTKSSRRNHA